MSKVKLPKPPRKYFTPPEIAAVLGCSHHRILEWINDGSMTAYNFSKTTGADSKPFFKMTMEDVDNFLETRRNKSSPPAVKSKRRKTKIDEKFFKE